MLKLVTGSPDSYRLGQEYMLLLEDKRQNKSG